MALLLLKWMLTNSPSEASKVCMCSDVTKRETRDVLPTCPCPTRQTLTFLSSSSSGPGWGLCRGELKVEEEAGDLQDTERRLTCHRCWPGRHTAAGLHWFWLSALHGLPEVDNSSLSYWERSELVIFLGVMLAVATREAEQSRGWNNRPLIWPAK